MIGGKPVLVPAVADSEPKSAHATAASVRCGCRRGLGHILQSCKVQCRRVFQPAAGSASLGVTRGQRNARSNALLGRHVT